MNDLNRSSPGSGLPENIALLVAYLFPLIGGIVVLLTVGNDNKKLKFHSWQSIFLGILIVAIYSLVGILASGVPSLWFLFIVLPIFTLAVLVFCVILSIFAYQGKTWELPVIGGLSHSLTDKE